MDQVSVVTLASPDRFDRVARQHQFLKELGVERHGLVVLGQGSDAPAGVTVIAELDGEELNLARARNLAGDWGRGVIIFLDADCVPGPDLVDRYVEAAQAHPGAVLTGPVTYLREGVVPATPWDTRPDPHPARPAVGEGEIRPSTSEDYDVFWSLTFALTEETWSEIRAGWGSFDERYVGYGGEDTDFGWRLRAHEVPLLWVGGAHAYHVWHPVSSPPWEHLGDIVDNANRFYTTWKRWPMQGWLDEFAAAGRIALRDGKWEVLR